jgi:hypothetical protein
MGVDMSAFSETEPRLRTLQIKRVGVFRGYRRDISRATVASKLGAFKLYKITAVALGYAGPGAVEVMASLR